MSDCQPSDPSRQTAQPSLFLDYGAAGDACCGGDVEICERGMRFKAQWQFSIGAQLSVAFCYRDRNQEKRRLAVEGLVADCQMVGEKCYCTTLLFVDLAEEVRKSIHDVSASLSLTAQISPV